MEEKRRRKTAKEHIRDPKSITLGAVALVILTGFINGNIQLTDTEINSLVATNTRSCRDNSVAIKECPTRAEARQMVRDCNEPILRELSAISRAIARLEARQQGHSVVTPKKKGIDIARVDQ